MKLIYLKSALKCDSFDLAIDIKIQFFRVLVTIEPGRSLLQFVTTNCLTVLDFKLDHHAFDSSFDFFFFFQSWLVPSCNYFSDNPLFQQMWCTHFVKHILGRLILTLLLISTCFLSILLSISAIQHQKRCFWCHLFGGRVWKYKTVPLQQLWCKALNWSFIRAPHILPLQTLLVSFINRLLILKVKDYCEKK